MSTELTAELATDVTRGLSDAEAARRLAAHGRNELPPPRARRAGGLPSLADQHADRRALVAAAVTAAISHWTDTGVILVIVALNATIGFVQAQR